MQTTKRKTKNERNNRANWVSSFQSLDSLVWSLLTFSFSDRVKILVCLLTPRFFVRVKALSTRRDVGGFDLGRKFVNVNALILSLTV